MTPNRHKPSLISADLQCWLLTACCALGGEKATSAPELGALRRAIQDRPKNVIATGFEVVCSHLKAELTRRQRKLAEALANELREGNLHAVRPAVLELCKV